MHTKARESARTLLGLGFDVNYVSSKEGQTALMHAAEIGNPDMIKLFLDAGADVNQADNEGETALQFAFAASKLNAESVKLLLTAGADVNHANNQGKTAIFEVCFDCGAVPFLKNLIDAGADVNHADNNGRTMLFDLAEIYNNNHEIYESDVEAVELLVAAKVDVNHAANDGRTALSIYVATQQRLADYLQNPDQEDIEDESYLRKVGEDIAILTKIVALLNERAAQQAAEAEAAAEAASGGL